MKLLLEEPLIGVVHLHRCDVASTVPLFKRLPVEAGVVTERGRRLPFTDDEVEAIEVGMERHPPVKVRGTFVYQWAAILNDPELRPIFHSSRTNVNLKVRPRAHAVEADLAPVDVIALWSVDVITL